MLSDLELNFVLCTQFLQNSNLPPSLPWFWLPGVWMLGCSSGPTILCPHILPHPEHMFMWADRGKGPWRPGVQTVGTLAEEKRAGSATESFQKTAVSVCPQYSRLQCRLVARKVDSAVRCLKFASWVYCLLVLWPKTNSISVPQFLHL